MARSIIRKPSFHKIVGAYRSQWKRFWMRLFTFGLYGRRGMGWWRNPKKAWYNFWYHRTSVSLYRLLGFQPSRGACFFGMLVASVVSIFAAPVDAARAGARVRKRGKVCKAGSGGTVSRSSERKTSCKQEVSRASSRAQSPLLQTQTATVLSGRKASPLTEPKRASAATMVSRTDASVSRAKDSKVGSSHRKAERVTESVATAGPVNASAAEELPKKSARLLNERPFPFESFVSVSAEQKPEAPKEPDESTPKSTPKHESDQYIRKRMMIAGSQYCDATVMEALSVGTYFDFVAEPDNRYDGDAVMLVWNGHKIGYLAKSDHSTFVTCLRLNRKIYGVITSIDRESKSAKYEFEAWFDRGK